MIVKKPRVHFLTRVVLGAFLLFMLPNEGWAESLVELASETITSFDVVYYDFDDRGSFSVEEKITYDFGEYNRHGIFRFIPLLHTQPAHQRVKDRFIDVALIEILRNGQPEQYVSESTKNEWRYRIGDPNKTIRGEHVYTIRYRVDGGLALTNDGAGLDFYWDVTGSGWEVPIVRATAKIETEKIKIFTDQAACYVGPVGANNPCLSIATSTHTATFITEALQPGEGFTIARAMDPTLVDFTPIERMRFSFIVLVTVLLGALGVGHFFYRQVTKYKTGRPIIAQYEPYKNFSPLYAGTLIDTVMHGRDVAATYIDLARRGFISIKHVPKEGIFSADDYEVTLKKRIDATEKVYEQELLKMLFKNADPGKVASLNKIAASDSRTKTNARKLSRLGTDIKEELHTDGYYEDTWQTNRPAWVVGGLLVGVIASVILSNFFPRIIPEWIVVFFFCSFFGLTFFGIIFKKRRTRLGYEAKNHLLGFRDFLETTDKDRYVFHNAPELSPQLFMKFLPYAIAFGVETKWVEVFKDVTIPAPEWYSDAAVNRYDLVTFVAAVDGFSDSISDTNMTSSSSNGSSGGGSSGGGSGGGGGGSW